MIRRMLPDLEQSALLYSILVKDEITEYSSDYECSDGGDYRKLVLPQAHKITQQ
jgi:hypothetical protein